MVRFVAERNNRGKGRHARKERQRRRKGIVFHALSRPPFEGTRDVQVNEYTIRAGIILLSPSSAQIGIAKQIDRFKGINRSFDWKLVWKRIKSCALYGRHLPWTSSLMSTARGSTRAVLLTLHVKVVLSSSRVICICSKLLAFPIPLSAIVVELDAGTGPIKRVISDMRFYIEFPRRGNNGLIVWEWFGAESEYDDERRCEWNLTREDSWSFPVWNTYMCRWSKRDGSIQAFLWKRLEKLLECREIA